MALGVLLLVLAVAAPAFFGKQQLLTMLTTAAPVLIAACGMTLVMICRQIDISIGSQFAVCSVLAGLMAKAGFPSPHRSQRHRAVRRWEHSMACWSPASDCRASS